MFYPGTGKKARRRGQAGPSPFQIRGQGLPVLSSAVAPEAKARGRHKKTFADTPRSGCIERLGRGREKADGWRAPVDFFDPFPAKGVVCPAFAPGTRTARPRGPPPGKPAPDPIRGRPPGRPGMASRRASGEAGARPRPRGAARLSFTKARVAPGIRSPTPAVRRWRRKPEGRRSAPACGRVRPGFRRCAGRSPARGGARSFARPRPRPARRPCGSKGRTDPRAER